MIGGYDPGYQSCNCFWGTVPGSLFKHLSEIIPTYAGLSVLDAGCGEGKNTAYLLQLGASVRSIDISPYALVNARAAWPQIAADQWEEADLRSVTLADGCLDIVVAYGSLHCLQTASEIKNVSHRLQRATRVGGFHVICAFNSRLQELEAAHPGFRPCLLEHGTYLDLYRA